MESKNTGFPVHHQLLELAQTHIFQLVMQSNHLILCVPFSSCLQSFPASGYFPMSWLFTSDGQSIGASVLATVLPINIRDWFSLGLTGLIFLLSKGLSRVFSSTTDWKHQFLDAQPSLWSNSHIWMITGETTALTIRTFVGKVMSLLFNMLSRFVSKMWTVNFQMFKLDLEKAEEPEIKLPTSTGSLKKQKNSRKTST